MLCLRVCRRNPPAINHMDGTATSRFQFRSAAGLALLLGLLSFALFAPALNYGFIDIDDVQYTIETPQVTEGLSPANIRWAFTTVHESWYSPLLWISFMADSTFFGTSPAAYRFTNLLLHALNAALLFWILRRLLPSPMAAFFAAALWAFHPLRVESVVWIAERKDVLSGFFFLLAVLAYLRHAERPSPLRIATVFLCMLGGMLSKTILIVLPPLLLILDAWPLRRAPFPDSRKTLAAWRPLLVEKVFLFLLMAAGIVLTLWTHHGAHNNAPPLSVLHRLMLVAPTTFAHLRQIFWPMRLSMFYPVDYPSAPMAILALSALLALLAAAWRLRRRLPGLLAGILWFGIALAPVVRGIRFDEQSAHPDRYTYLPAIGLSLAFASLFVAACRVRRGRLVAVVLSGLLVVACGFRTVRYLPLWTSPETLGPVLLRQVPDHPLVNNLMGKWLAAQGRPEDAIPYFQNAKRWNVQATCNLVTALLRAGRPDEALTPALDACAHPEAPPDAFLALGIAYLQLDRAAEAVAPLQRATNLLPGHPLPWQMLYRAHVEAGQLAAADDALRALRNLDAFDVQDFDGLTRLYVRTWRAGDVHLAWPFFANNLPRRPGDVLLHNSAAWLLATTPNPPSPPPEAVRLARLALDAAGGPHPSLLDTLAAAQAADRDFDAAIQTATEALAQLSPADPLQTAIRGRIDLYRRREPYRESLSTDP